MRGGTKSHWFTSSLLDFSRTNPHLSAPQALTRVRQGNAMGLRVGSWRCALKGAQDPSALAGRTIRVGDDTRGVVPDEYPARRWRDHLNLFSMGENCQKLYVRLFRESRHPS